MRTTNYNGDEINNTKSTATRTNYSENRINSTKSRSKVAKRYTGTKSTNELRSAMCIDSTVRPVDYYNK